VCAVLLVLLPIHAFGQAGLPPVGAEAFQRDRGIEGEFLYGLTYAEIEDIVVFYTPGEQPVELEPILDQLRAPFDPSKFGDLEADVGPEAAYDLIGAVIELARRRVPLEEIVDEIEALTHEAEVEWAAAVGAVAETEAELDEADRSFAEGGDGAASYRIQASASYKNYIVYFISYAKVKTQKSGGLFGWKSYKSDSLRNYGEWSCDRVGGGNTTLTWDTTKTNASSNNKSRTWWPLDHKLSTLKIEVTGKATDSAFGTITDSDTYP